MTKMNDASWRESVSPQTRRECALAHRRTLEEIVGDPDRFPDRTVEVARFQLAEIRGEVVLQRKEIRNRWDGDRPISEEGWADFHVVSRERGEKLAKRFPTIRIKSRAMMSTSRHLW